MSGKLSILCSIPAASYTLRNYLIIILFQFSLAFLLGNTFFEATISLSVTLIMSQFEGLTNKELRSILPFS